jgi:type III secretion system FlhB-like substrate exporter
VSAMVRENVADRLLDLARRRGVEAGDERTIVELLGLIEPAPLVPHRLALVAGAVLAMAFRHDRDLAAPDAPAARLSADRSL